MTARPAAIVRRQAEVTPGVGTRSHAYRSNQPKCRGDHRGDSLESCRWASMKTAIPAPGCSHRSRTGSCAKRRSAGFTVRQRRVTGWVTEILATKYIGISLGYVINRNPLTPPAGVRIPLPQPHSRALKVSLHEAREKALENWKSASPVRSC